MAFEMTHLRFALELAPRLGIKDLPAYLAGSIYPDSRYKTGLLRNATHGPDTPRDPFDPNLDDFAKGWATHIAYDEATIDAFKRLSPWPENRIVGFGKEWVFTTAAKLVADLTDFDSGTISPSILDSIQAPPPPRREDSALLTSYYTEIKDLYRHRPALDDYRRVLLGWKTDKEAVEQQTVKAQELLDDPDIVAKISRIYPETLARFSA